MIVIKRTKKEWETTDTVLRQNEIGQETNSARIKIGDGKTPWSKLPFVDSRLTDVNTLVLDGGSP